MMGVLSGKLGESKTVQHTSQKATAILMNKTNLKQIDKENSVAMSSSNPYPHNLQTAATSGVSNSVITLSAAKQPPVKIRTLF